MAGPTLQIPVSASLDKFRSDMDQLGREADKTSTDIEDRFKQINPGAKGMIDSFRDSAKGPAQDAGNSIGLIIGGAIVAAAAGIASGLHAAIDALAKIGDRGEDLRLPVNMLQALSVAATEARVPAEKLNSALDRFTAVSKQNVDDAEKFYKALGNIGEGFVTAFKNAPSQAERVRIISDAFKSTTDEVKKAQLGLQALGTDNERLIGIFDKGRDGIAGYLDQVRRLGLEINEEFVKKAQEAKSQISLFSRVLNDEFSTSLASLIPVFVSLLPYIERLGAVVRDTIGAFASNDDQRPLETLRNELTVLDTQLAEVAAKRDRLTSNTPTKMDSLRDTLRKIIGEETGTDLSENIADLDKQIDEIKKRRAVINSLITSKSDSKPLSITVAPAFKPRPSLTEDDSGSAFDKEIDRLKRHAALIEADAASVGKTAAAHAQLRAEMQLLQAVERENDDVTVEMLAKYAQLRSTMSATEALQQSGIKLTSDQAEAFLTVTTRVGQMTDVLNKNKTAFEGFNESLKFAGNQLVDVLDGILNKTQSLSDLGRSALRAFQKELLRAAITGEGAFAKLLGANSTNGGVGGLLGLLGGSVGSGGTSFLPGASLLSGNPTGLAEGTDNWRGGPVWVGERGPELLNLPKGAQVTPSDISRSMAGGVSVNPVFNVDATGASDAAVMRLERALARTAASIKPLAVQAMMQHQQRYA